MTNASKIPAALTTLTLHKVMADRDMGGSHLIGYFANLTDAQKAGKGKSEWGADARIETKDHMVVVYADPTTGVETIRLVSEEIYVFYESPEETKSRALEKLRGAHLSVAELKALGL